MISGKQIRMERILNRRDGRTIIIPMDHGITVGPIPGLEDMAEAVDAVVKGGADAVLMHKGMVGSGHRGYGGDVGLIVHLSGSTSKGPDPNAKRIVTTVEQAVKLGADAVSIHINVGSDTEAEMLQDLGMVAEAADEWGMPLLAMMYPRGHDIKDPYDVEVVKLAARIGVELGADIIKTNYTGDKKTFREVVRGAGRVPVVIAGGEKAKDIRGVLQTVKDSLEAGGAGVAMGRNVFQADDPSKMVAAVNAIVHKNKTVEESMKYLK
ncbi:MAG: class I fructose-bisphosphate aldolase family protein [Candidatus Altiarchaeota archaeon]|nr:class I fructose-bisphosphate aldolase family protein [Candidatus Altiarchaeota archaeon]